MSAQSAPEPQQSRLVEIPAANFTMNRMGRIVAGLLAVGMVLAVVTSAIAIAMIRRAGGHPATNDYVWTIGPAVLLIICLWVFSSQVRRERKIVSEARAVIGVVVHRRCRRRSVTLTYQYRDPAGRVYSAKAQGAGSDVGDHIEVIYAASAPNVSLPTFGFWFYSAPALNLSST